MGVPQWPTVEKSLLQEQTHPTHRRTHFIPYLHKLRSYHNHSSQEHYSWEANNIPYQKMILKNWLISSARGAEPERNQRIWSNPTLAAMPLKIRRSKRGWVTLFWARFFSYSMSNHLDNIPWCYKHSWRAISQELTSRWSCSSRCYKYYCKDEGHRRRPWDEEPWNR